MTEQLKDIMTKRLNGMRLGDEGYAYIASFTYNQALTIMHQTDRNNLLREWLKEHTTGKYHIGWSKVGFEKSEDCLMFSLRWL